MESKVEKIYIIYEYDGPVYNPYKWTKNEEVKEYYENLTMAEYPGFGWDVSKYDVVELKEDEDLYRTFLQETSNTSKYGNMCEKGIYCEECEDIHDCEIAEDIINNARVDNIEEAKKEEEEL